MFLFFNYFLVIRLFRRGFDGLNFWMNHLEEERRSRGTRHRRRPIKPQVQHWATPPNEALCQDESRRNRGVECATGEATDGIRRAQHGHADREPVVVVILLHRARNVQHDGDERERVNAFGEHRA